MIERVIATRNVRDCSLAKAKTKTAEIVIELYYLEMLTQDCHQLNLRARPRLSRRRELAELVIFHLTTTPTS